LETMRAVQVCLGLWWFSFAYGGVLKAPEELTLEAAVENAELEDYAANALLTEEERKIVALLERIENKFGTLDDSDKEEFVKKISNYQDRFASTLAKVETIPGMYGLDVPMLRANLGIHGEDTLEEIHVEYDGDIPDAAVEVAPDFEETIQHDASSLGRGAAVPLEAAVTFEPISVVSDSRGPDAQAPVGLENSKPKRTIDDVYNVMSQLVQLVLVQIVQEHNKPEPVLNLPAHFYQAPRPVQPSYHYSRPRVQVQASVKPRVSARPRKPMPAYNSGPAVGKVPFNHELAGLLNAIPPVYEDVSMNFNFPKKLRKRRSVIAEPPPVAEVEEDVHDEVHKDGDALQSAQDYADWYNTQYLPWYEHYAYQMQLYQQAMIAYEAAQLRTLVPFNPFGDVDFGNPFPFYSKTNYMQSLHDDVAGLDPQETYREPYEKWVCERKSDGTEGEKCWVPSTATDAGYCGVVTNGQCGPAPPP